MNENKKIDERAALGQAPVSSLLVKLSIPATVAMAVNGLYNLVDTIFIGRGVGTDAIGGLALAFPAQMIVMAFGMSIGQGSASIVSRALGAGEDSRARRAAGNAFALALFLGLATFISGTLLLEPLLNLLGAREPLRDHATEYLKVILVGSPFIAMAMVSNNLLRAEGKARVSMTVMLIGAVTNIILDPLFIFVFKMGVAGAAWATVSGQFLAFVYASRFFLLRRSLIQVLPKHWIPKGSVLREIVVLGIPSFIRQSGQSIVSIMVNNLLGLYGGAIFISAYGVVNRLIMFLFMPLFGLIQGFQPIAGFNYGAGLFKRVLKTVKITLLYASIYTTAGFFILMLFPRSIAAVFSSDPDLLDTVAVVIRYVVAIFPLVGMQIVGGTYFMVVGKAVPSLVLNLARQFLLLIPLLLILPPVLGLQGLLLTFPLADALAAIITGVWFSLELKHLNREAG
ncbi:MATE family efflux transporter [Spirochaeta isovalerica]|uniref:Multidrug export protein MepA n=1 Tax=Spirochaeta isovalerica TaxID=150 RepID=A0A841R6E7_9SPIO|nr:MATE family efflux transporter [Spirochaeta isovalerica]MBB6478961.1 putative MATE family efflux protein [Spirochaeta isovalerica]